MSLQIELRNETMIDICTKAIPLVRADYEDHKQYAINSLAKEIEASNGFLWWRHWTGRRLTQAEALEQARVRYHNPDTWDWSASYDKARMLDKVSKLEGYIAAATHNEFQTVKLTGGDAGMILRYAERINNATA